MAIGVPLQRVGKDLGRPLTVLSDEQKVPDLLDRTVNEGLAVMCEKAFLVGAPSPQSIPEVDMTESHFQNEIRGDTVRLETDANIDTGVVPARCVRVHNIEVNRQCWRQPVKREEIIDERAVNNKGIIECRRRCHPLPCRAAPNATASHLCTDATQREPGPTEVAPLLERVALGALTHATFRISETPTMTAREDLSEGHQRFMAFAPPAMKASEIGVKGSARCPARRRVALERILHDGKVGAEFLSVNDELGHLFDHFQDTIPLNRKHALLFEETIQEFPRVVSDLHTPIVEMSAPRTEDAQAYITPLREVELGLGNAREVIRLLGQSWCRRVGLRRVGQEREQRRREGASLVGKIISRHDPDELPKPLLVTDPDRVILLTVLGLVLASLFHCWTHQHSAKVLRHLPDVSARSPNA